MDLILTLLLLLGTALRPAPVERLLQRAHAQAHGLEVLRGKRVLMFGDSMVNCGINVWLAPWFRHHGVASYVTRSWASSTTVSWAHAPKLTRYLWRFDPDVVIVMLGSNELFHPYPRMKIRPIQRILKRIGKRRLIFWIGPPAWKPDKGIIAVMRAQLPSGHFFDSAPLSLRRQKDGYHPNMAGSKTWAMATRAWLTKRLRALYPLPRASSTRGRNTGTTRAARRRSVGSPPGTGGRRRSP